MEPAKTPPPSRGPLPTKTYLPERLSASLNAITSAATHALALMTRSSTQPTFKAVHAEDPSTKMEMATAAALSTLSRAAPAAAGGAGRDHTAPSLRMDERNSVKGVEPFYMHITPVPKKLRSLPKELQSIKEEALESVTLERTVWDDPLLNDYVIPTHEGMALLAAYYQKKYGISILVTQSQAMLENALLGKSTPEGISVWGVIAARPGTDLHVSPVLCLRQPDGRIQIANLDSVGNLIPALIRVLDTFKETHQPVTIFSIIGPRQADSYNCRTDALVILKDSLRDVKSKSLTDLTPFLKPEESLGVHYFYLPVEWGKTVQRSSVLKDRDLSTRVVRSPDKKEESLAEFRLRYRSSAEKTEHFTLRLKKLDEEGKSYLETSALTVTSSAPVNRFLNYKSRTNLAKVKELAPQLKSDPELKAIYQNRLRTLSR